MLRLYFVNPNPNASGRTELRPYNKQQSYGIFLKTF